MDLLEQAPEHVPEEPEEPVAVVEEGPQVFLQLAALVEPERSSCTGRSTSLCTVTFWSPRA
jgi:hypothetical protein